MRIETPVLFYLNEAWNRGKGWLACLLVACLCARTAGKIFLYFGVAPVILRGRPVRLAKSQAITAVTSRIPGDFGVELWPGESLRVKRGFLRASSDAFTRGRRLVLNGAIPLTCARCGLTWMIELRNRHAGGGRLVVLGQADGSGGELTMIAVPEGASVVLRPRFLVGVITKAGERLVIRRRWPLLRWQSWVTREFRFLEFTGPCRLIVAARGGVRVERLVEQDGQPQALLRIEQEVIIGFTPTLNYQPVKAVSFWSYYRGRGPLFARLLSGSGLCLLQEKAPQHG